MLDAGSAHPRHWFELDAPGDLNGFFDGHRVQQVVTNLLTNAGQYSASGSPIVTTVRGTPATLSAQVVNHGPVIPPDALKSIFEPLVQLAAAPLPWNPMRRTEPSSA